MNIRKLQLKDAFTVSKIIKNANLKKVVADGYKEVMAGNSDQEYAGINLFFDIITGISDEKVEKEVYKLISDVAGVEDASTMDFDELQEFITTVIKENNIANFMRAVKKGIE